MTIKFEKIGGKVFVISWVDFIKIFDGVLTASQIIETKKAILILILIRPNNSSRWWMSSYLEKYWRKLNPDLKFL